MNTAQTQASDIRNIQQKESHLSNQQKERESIHIAFSGPVLSEEWRDSSTCHSELQWSACMETHAGVCQCQFQSLRQCSFANKTRSMCFKKMFVERDSLAQLIHKVKFFFCLFNFWHIDWSRPHCVPSDWCEYFEHSDFVYQTCTVLEPMSITILLSTLHWTAMLRTLPAN